MPGRVARHLHCGRRCRYGWRPGASLQIASRRSCSMLRTLRARRPSPAMVVALHRPRPGPGGHLLRGRQAGQEHRRQPPAARERRHGGRAEGRRRGLDQGARRLAHRPGRQRVDARRSAERALSAAGAGRATVADGLAQIVYRASTTKLGPAPGNGTSNESDFTEVRCPEGHRVIGGGIQLDPDGMSQVDGFPSAGARAGPGAPPTTTCSRSTASRSTRSASWRRRSGDNGGRTETADPHSATGDLPRT